LAATLNERVRIALTPRPWRHERARAAARHEFLAHGLPATRGRTGVLIYVALAERYAEIVADSAVRARIPDGEWRVVLGDLLAAAGRGELGPGLVVAVERVGGVLEAAFPGDKAGNELPNRVIVLE
ncbi:TPM domain-containing protein, partial [Methylorubrum suomiense]